MAHNTNVLVLLLSLLASLGAFLIFLSFYLPTISKTVSKASSQVSARVIQAFRESVKRNNLLFNDRNAIEQQLALIPLRFNGKPITLMMFVRLSLLTGFLAFLFAVISTSGRGNVNLVAILIATTVGFAAPRWVLIILDGQLKRGIAGELPQVIAKIADFARLHPNLERAVAEATPELPKATRRYFQHALKRRQNGEYVTFAAMMYDIAKKAKSQTLADFAHLCLTDTTLGGAERHEKLRRIQIRARKLLLASKLERKDLNAKALKVIIAYVFLAGIWVFEILIKPELGQYLYSTAIGRLLLAAVYITWTFNAALFTWLYYDA